MVFGSSPGDPNGLKAWVAVNSVDEDSFSVKLRLGFVHAEDRALVELLVCVVLRVRVALGGINEDAILVSHRKRIGLPPAQPSGLARTTAKRFFFSLSAPAGSVMASRVAPHTQGPRCQTGRKYQVVEELRRVQRLVRTKGCVMHIGLGTLLLVLLIVIRIIGSF
jgi:hypothetical protein